MDEESRDVPGIDGGLDETLGGPGGSRVLGNADVNQTTEYAWTPLLTAARAKGATVMTGRELAIYQAADAFELFTGLVPSTAEMGIAFDDVMAKRYAASHAA